jgi:hypothetical protein
MGPSRLLFVLALVSSVSCGDAEGLPDLPPPPPGPVVAERQVVGCYEYAPGKSAWPPVRYVAPWELPRRFYLTGDLHTVVVSDRRTAVLWKVEQTDSCRGVGTWQLIGHDTIVVAWSNDFEGVRVTLGRSSGRGSWQGRTEPFSETGVVVPGRPVMVRRVRDAACR